MRVFLPSTLPALAKALQAGHVGQASQAGQAGQPGFAVTPALREAYASGDQEELEYTALTEAARASLRLLAADPPGPPGPPGPPDPPGPVDPPDPPRRVVLAAEIPADHVRWDPAPGEPARVLISEPVPLKWLAAAHVDDRDAAQDVRSAAQALPAADAGDEDAQFTVDGAEGHELAWYATQELPYLIE